MAVTAQSPSRTPAERAAEVQKVYADWTLIKRLLREARPHWLAMFAVLGLTLFATPLSVLMPLPINVAFDSVAGDMPIAEKLPSWVVNRIELPPWSRNKQTLLFACIVGLVLIHGSQQLRGYITKIFRAYVAESLVLDFRRKVFGHVKKLSIAFHDERGAADSIYRIQYDAMAVQRLFTDGVIPLTGAIFQVLGVVAMTLYFDWQLTLIALAVAPVIAVLTQIFRKRIRTRWTQMKRIESTILGVIQEVLGGMRVVKAFGQEGREQRRFTRESRRGVWAKVRVTAAEGGLSFLLGMTIACGTSTIVYFGVRHLQLGYITFGELAHIGLLLGMIYQPIELIGVTVGAMQNSLAAANRAFLLLEEDVEVVERPNAKSLDRAEGRFKFDGVTFRYGDHQVLHDVSFVAQAGARVGISGHTGSGKTTLISLLTRFYDPTSGRILLDGVDLRDYKLADLRQQFAIVLQEPVLFSGSLAENIAYGRPNASMDEIVAAAKHANAHEFIERLPGGYGAEVGDRGNRLSGGERQRVSLARAFLKDAPILILDEPTSSVDVKTEAMLMDAMDRLMQGRTTFMISHRPGTLDGCSLRLELDRGELVDGPRSI